MEIDYIVLLLNRGKIEREIEEFWKDIRIGEGATVLVRDLWKKKDIGEFTNSFSDNVSPYSSRLLRVTLIKTDN